MPEEATGLLEEFARTLAHRGPDDRRLLCEGPVGMAFNRLSLVNPEDGAQPLVSADGNLVLIVNGEVYNHKELEAGLPSGTRLSTRSDCEVLLYLYQRDGMRFLDRVNGMFAFVLWDRARGVLLMGRDRFGIKPLYYHRDGERIVFASEMKALFADSATPRRLDWTRALSEYDMNATPGFVHGRVTTWFEDIQLVAPGTVTEVRLRDGATTEHRYWELPGPDAHSDMTDEDYVAEFRELLAASVADCATADTELGLFLSGGIDSAAVAALSPGGLQTFTALTPGTVLNGDARGGHRTAELLGLANHQVLIGSDRVPSPQEWRDLVWLAETPMVGPEVFYKFELHRYARQNHPGIKGMLLGAAADEVYGGYIPNFAGAGGDWDDFESNLRDLHRRQALEHNPKLGHWWEHDGVPLLNDAVIHPASRYADDHYAGYAAWQYRTLEQYNVWHEDRTAAGNGVEARVPFLDHRLVELVARIPAARRSALLWDKRIVRDAMKGILPEEIRTRPKGYFFYGEGARHTNRALTRLLAQDGAALLEEALSSDNARRYLNADGLRSTLGRLTRSPSTGSIELLLRIVNLGLLEAMTAQLPSHPSQAAARPRPVELKVDDWEADADRIVARVVSEPELDQEAVYALADNVLLATVPAQPDSWFVVVDGSFEYEVSATGDAGWLSVLRTLDGTLTLSETLAKAGSELAEVADLFQEALAVGLITAEPGTGDPVLR